MALTGLRSKYQSPTDSAIFCNIENLINLEFNFHAFYCAESLTIQGNEMAESHETYTNSALNHGRRMSKWMDQIYGIPFFQEKESHQQTMYPVTQSGSEQSTNLWRAHFDHPLQNLWHHQAFPSWNLFHRAGKTEGDHYVFSHCMPGAWKDGKKMRKLPWRNWICVELQLTWFNLHPFHSPWGSALDGTKLSWNWGIENRKKRKCKLNSSFNGLS